MFGAKPAPSEAARPSRVHPEEDAVEKEAQATDADSLLAELNAIAVARGPAAGLVPAAGGFSLLFR